MITISVEFYDQHGLMLHSGFYSHHRTFEVFSLKEGYDKAKAALDVFGGLYAEAKTVTLRCDLPDKTFPVTMELINPRFENKSA